MKNLLFFMLLLLFFAACQGKNEPGEPFTEPTESIEANNLEDLYQQVDRLPETPIGDGRCQLIKKMTNKRYVAECQGECETGDCFTNLSIVRNNIKISCDCK